MRQAAGRRPSIDRKITVPGLDGCRLKWSRTGQPSFRYRAAVIQERLFAVTVICLGVLTVALVAAALF